MGTAWASAHSYPWEHGDYVGGIETVKVNIMLRIYSNKWHVYAGLAILNPAARVQIDQYFQSTNEIFKLMLVSDEQGLRSRIYAARDKVFGLATNRAPILLSEDVLDKFSLAKKQDSAQTSSSADSASSRSAGGGDSHSRSPKANSHLSLLAMVDCWANLGIQPFVHLDLAATPIFRMWIGVAEYLFRSQERLDAALTAALHDVSRRSDDLEFVIAAGGWSRCVSYGSFGLYRQRFLHTESFFESRFEEATKVGTAMIKALMDSSPQI
jgi:prephenate dehydrogenase (NADP+)